MPVVDIDETPTITDGSSGATITVTVRRTGEEDFACEMPNCSCVFKAYTKMIRGPDRGLLQKTQTSKLPNLTTCARTPFWSFCAGQRRIGPGQITDGT